MNGLFNHLSMIYKMEMCENNPEDPEYRFILGTNDGIAFLQINKQTLSMTIARETHLKGLVVNNLLVRNDRIIAFVHDHQKFYLIDRKTRDVVEMPWLANSPICCTGLQWAPGYHPREMSVIFVRGTNGVHMVNTQTWHITTLVNLHDGGAKFPDLSLLQIEAGEDHRLVVYTCD